MGGSVTLERPDLDVGILNLLGLDNLADYSEFIFEKEVMIATPHHQMSIVVPLQ